jgi:hypothetical protein
MRDGGRSIRRGLRLSAIAAKAAVLAVGMAAVLLAGTLLPAAGAATPPSRPGSGSSSAAPLLPLKIQLGSLTIDLSLPLDLSKLITVQSPSTSTPPPVSTPPASTPPGGRSSTPPARSTRPPSATSPSHPAAVPHPGASQRHASDRPAPAGAGGAVARTSAHRAPAGHRKKTAPRSTPAHHSHSAGAGGFVLVKRLVPGTGIGLLVGLVIATALGVAFVVRLSGRRGARRT